MPDGVDNHRTFTEAEENCMDLSGSTQDEDQTPMISIGSSLGEQELRDMLNANFPEEMQVFVSKWTYATGHYLEQTVPQTLEEVQAFAIKIKDMLDNDPQGDHSDDVEVMTGDHLREDM